MTELIRMTQVTKVYQESASGALNGVSLEVQEGEFTAVMGPSGSGKSTLLNLVAGLDRPSAGNVAVAGFELNGMSEAALARFRRDRIGFVFQFFHLLPNLTAMENLLMPAQLAGRKGGEARARELLARLGIADMGNRYPAKLSGGQQQRVAMGRALINQPTLLLADEPTGALDTRSGDQVMGLLAEINRQGQTVLMVTHDPKLAARYASRVVSVIDGLVVDDLRLHTTTERRAEDVVRVRAEKEVSS
jgi:putative ABC transport system ATP-binding protein